MRIGIEELSKELKEKLEWDENLIIKTYKHHIVITDPSTNIIGGADLDGISEIARKYRYTYYVGWDYCKERLEAVIN